MGMEVGISTKDCNGLSCTLKYKETIEDSDKEAIQNGDKDFFSQGRI